MLLNVGINGGHSQPLLPIAVRRLQISPLRVLRRATPVATVQFSTLAGRVEATEKGLYARMSSLLEPYASIALTKENPIPDARRMLDRQTLDVVYSAAYEELRRLARSVKNSWPACALTPSTLVHEAWLKLAKSSTMSRYSELQFKYIAAQAMYEILVDVARRNSALKRGGKEILVALDDSMDLSVSCGSDILALRDALEELTELSPRQSEIVKSRFFGGLTEAEIASVFEVSKATAGRDWRSAKAWLKSKIRQARRS
jgi:RNA polymerase sigma factor (TIGR02999 family)